MFLLRRGEVLSSQGKCSWSQSRRAFEEAIKLFEIGEMLCGNTERLCLMIGSPQALGGLWEEWGWKWSMWG